MFFDNWYGLLRVLVTAAAGYIALVFILRTSGKRTLSKMNAFDLVVTVALGSTFATVVLSKDVALVEGVVAFAALAGLQFITSWLSVRHKPVERLLKAEPSLLVYRGEYHSSVMRRVRITESEVMGALRDKGMRWDEAEAVVLETDGSLSVVPRSGGDTTLEVLSDVRPQPPSSR